MTKEERDEIGSYVAENFISPLCFSEESAKDVYLKMTGTKFNEFIAFLNNMIKEE